MRRRKNGFVIMELVLAAGLLSMLLGAAWLFFLAGGRQSERMDRETASLQARVLLRERLASDAAQATALELGDAEAPGGIVRKLKMRRIVAPKMGKASDGSTLDVRETVYEFDRATGSLTREGFPVPAFGVKDLEFRKSGTSGVLALLSMESEASTTTTKLELRAGLRDADGVLAGWVSAFEERPAE